jgi:hypothetical protein
VKGWAQCTCPTAFDQVKVYVDVKNVGTEAFEIGAGLGSPWRLLLGPAGRKPFETPPPTPAPIGPYGSIDYGFGGFLSVPPNPPDLDVANERDYATTNWPEAMTLEPNSGYSLIPPTSIAQGDGVVHQGSTLVFNIPKDNTFTIEGIALVVDGKVIGENLARASWPERGMNDI